jgi:signal transduction histidine kinase
VKNNIIKILEKITKSKNTEDGRARQQYILNIMLTTIIILVTIGLIIISYRLIFSNIENYQNNSISLLVIFVILSLFIALRIASHSGHDRFSSYALIIILFLLATYMGCKWGIDLPAEILFYVLVIVISGILIGSKLSFINTILITTTFITVNTLQDKQIIKIDRSWIEKPWGNSDIVVTSVILLIIATVLWLFNRELKKSETELKNERDFLEVKIEEKTKELLITQAKEISQVYQFAEFGKLSSGLFHDLVNPLTALMLNISKVKIDSDNDPNFKIIKSEIDQALKASEKMKDYIISVRKQINFQNQKEIFSLNKEIEEAICILNYKIRKNNIDLIFSANDNIKTTGDPIKFNQIVTNLVSNAIDACENEQTKEIIIDLAKSNNLIELKITDSGKGVSKDIISQIFEPFFTTKNSGNLGLGLSLIKKIIEESFSGTITVSSELNIGTIFTVKLPLETK